MQKVALDAKACEVSAELVHRGIAADARVHALVEVVGEDAELPPMAAVAEAGGAFDWLADEPDLYTDTDLQRPPRAG
ncbi:hypothetical protein GCM10009416_28390 [Craurococcus roseus]|uniref:Uncharacterized protein n=1 Tax=Craurococcus roseus TaxID=77585 RepID=A0ABN1FD22_9PROT